MDIEFWRSFFLTLTIVDMAIVLWWFLWITFARDTLYRMHTEFFPVSKEDFYKVHYFGMALVKILIMIFNLAPLIALHLVDP